MTHMRFQHVFYGQLAKQRSKGSVMRLGPGECVHLVEVQEHRLPAAAVLFDWVENLDGPAEPQPARLPGGAN